VVDADVQRPLVGDTRMTAGAGDFERRNARIRIGLNALEVADLGGKSVSGASASGAGRNVRSKSSQLSFYALCRKCVVGKRSDSVERIFDQINRRTNAPRMPINAKRNSEDDARVARFAGTGAAGGWRG